MLDKLAKIGSFLGGVAAAIAVSISAVYFLISISAAIYFQDIVDRLDEMDIRIEEIEQAYEDPVTTVSP